MQSIHPFLTQENCDPVIELCEITEAEVLPSTGSLGELIFLYLYFLLIPYISYLFAYAISAPPTNDATVSAASAVIIIFTYMNVGVMFYVALLQLLYIVFKGDFFLLPFHDELLVFVLRIFVRPYIAFVNAILNLILASMLGDLPELFYKMWILINLAQSVFLLTGVFERIPAAIELIQYIEGKNIEQNEEEK